MSNTTKSSSVLFKGLCRQCGEAGHRAADCQAATDSQAATSSVPFKGLCRQCGEAGHQKKNCPVPTAGDAGHKEPPGKVNAETLWAIFGSSAKLVADGCSRAVEQTQPGCQNQLGCRVSMEELPDGGFVFSFSVLRKDVQLHESGAAAASDDHVESVTVAESGKRPTQRGGKRHQKKKAAAAAAANSLAKEA